MAGKMIRGCDDRPGKFDKIILSGTLYHNVILNIFTYRSAVVRTSKLITISLLPDLLQEAEKLAKEENRSRSDLFREAIRRYIEDKKWERLYRYGRIKAKEQGLSEAPDNRILECAIEGQADSIISGDRHLLNLKTYRRIEIVPPTAFLERVAI